MHAINRAQTNTSHRWRWQFACSDLCPRLCDYWFTGASLGSACNDTEHMETIAPLILGHIRGRSSAMSKFCSVKEYIQYTKMDKQGTWGTEIELLVLSHLLKTSIYTY